VRRYKIICFYAEIYRGRHTLGLDDLWQN
jgi:hypothetical protein